MTMALLFLSYLFGGLFQLSPLSAFWRKMGSSLLFGFQFYLFYLILVSQGIQILNVGNWPHYAGITWMKDPMSVFFVAAPLILFPPTYYAMLKHFGENRLALSLLFFFCASLVGAFFTADLFNLFVMFEILLLSSYTFFARADKLVAGKLFIWANIVGSALFLIAVACIYKVIGTVNMADISVRVASLPSEVKNFLFWVMGFVFLFKAGLWPLYLWMPSSYPSLPPSLLAFFGVLSSKVGLYAFVRWSSLFEWQPIEAISMEFQMICALTMLFAATAAFSANNFRSSLAYWSLSHIGISLLAVCMLQPLGLSGLLLYFLQDVVIASALFFYCDAHERAGSPRQIFSRSPFAACVFIFLALSASGFPLTSGFWPKWIFLKASIESPLIFISLIVSAILFLGLSISLWNRYFVGASQTQDTQNKIKIPWQVYYCIGFSILFSIFGIIGQNLLYRSAELSYRPEMFLQKVLEKTQSVEASREEAQP